MKAKLITFVRGLSNGTPPRFQSYLKSLTLLLGLVVSVNLWGTAVSGTFSKFTGVLEEGDYVIVYGNYALANSISSNRFTNGSPTISNNAITNPDESIVWHIAPNGDYWTIYNAKVSKYAGGNSSKNQGALIASVTDYAKFSVSSTSTSETYDFENYGCSIRSSNPGNKWLRSNNKGTTKYGWACYANSTDGAVTLYKLASTKTTLSFSLNGGSGTKPTDITDFPATLPSTDDFTKSGYRPNGWNTKSDGTGTHYNSGATFTPSESITLYVEWKKTYTVTYNGNNNKEGSVPTDSNSPYDENSSVTVLGNTGNLVKTGYSWSGWNTNNSGTGTDRAAGSTFTITSNTTLYAKWTANKYNLTFDKNDAGAGGSMAQQEFTFNVAQNLNSNTFTAPAHKYFTGWATTAGGTKTYNDGASYKMTTEGATLYAVWAWNKTEITLDKQGGNGGNSKVTATYNSEMPSAGSVPTKAGYDFNGYYTGQNGTGTQYYSSTNTSVQNWDKDDASLTLYAYWTPKTITITLAANGHSDAGGSFTIVYGTKAYKFFTAVTPHTGYTVRGYYTGSACTGAIVVNPDGTLGGQLNNWIDAEGNWIKSSDGTLYAGYTPDKHTVAWVVNGNSWTGKGGSTKADYDAKVAAVPTAPETSDCDFMKVFVGWTASPIGGTTNTPPSDLFTDAANAPIITGDATYHAVFATADESTTDYAKGTLEDLQTGKRVLLVHNKYSNNYAVSSIPSTENYLDAVSVSVVNSKITTSNASIIWNVTKNNTQYKFDQGSNKKLNVNTTGLYANTTDGSFVISTKNSAYELKDAVDDAYIDYWGSSGFSKLTTSHNDNCIDFYLPATDYSEYATTCVECTNVITITKGAEVAHGSYSLSKTGDVCLSNIPGGTYSVTVTATPDEHYHLATVATTSSGIAGEVVGNTCVVSDITASTTLTAVFEEDPKVTVTWHKGASATETTSNVYVGTLYSAISEYAPSVDDDAAGSCADKFMGWATASISDISGVDESDVEWVTDDYEIDNTHKDIYAVFAKGSDGGTGSVVLSYTSLGLTTGYESGSTKTVSDIDFYLDGIMTGNSGSVGYQKIQFRRSKNGSGYIYNSEAMPGNITSIVLNSTTQNMTIYFGTSSNPSTNSQTCTSSSLTATPSGNYEYFKIINADDAAAYIGTITINYSSVSYSNYVTSCEAPVVWTVEGNFGEGWKDYDITDGKVVINNLAKNSSYDFKVHKTVGTSHNHYGATGDDNKYTTSGTNWTLNGTFLRDEKSPDFIGKTGAKKADLGGNKKCAKGENLGPVGG